MIKNVNDTAFSPPLLPPLTEETNLERIIIGNSNYTDDLWDLSPFIRTLTVKPSAKQIRWSASVGSEKMVRTMKQYAYVKLGEVNASTVCYKIKNAFPQFREFSKEYFITDFTEVTVKAFRDFMSWLTEKWKAGQLSAVHCYQASLIIEEVITKGNVKGWNVSNIYIKGLSGKTWWKRVRVETEENKRKPIPLFVLNQILDAARCRETDMLVKSIIITLSQTGLRISDVSSLKTGYLRQDKDGNLILDIWIQKSDQEAEARMLHKIFINEWTAQTIREMEAYTLGLRDRLRKDIEQKITQIRTSTLPKLEQDAQINELKRTDISDHLFIYTNGIHSEKNKILVLNQDKWTKRLQDFMERWQIVDEDGTIYPIQTHQFRHTFVSELIRQGVPLPFIQKHLAHMSEEMTNYYSTLNDEQVKKDLAMKFLHPEAQIAGKRAEEIKEQTAPLFRGKTLAEIEEIIEELADELSFNLLPAGICIYDEVRGRCTNGDGCFFYNCSNYFATEKNYPVLKQELDKYEKYMDQYKSSERKRDYDRLFIVWKHLRPLVDELEAKIHGKKEH